MPNNLGSWDSARKLFRISKDKNIGSSRKKDMSNDAHTTPKQGNTHKDTHTQTHKYSRRSTKLQKRKG